MSKLVASEREKLLHLSDELHKRVVGQDDAVEAVADAIQRSRCGVTPDMLLIQRHCRHILSRVDIVVCTCSSWPLVLGSWLVDEAADMLPC